MTTIQSFTFNPYQENTYILHDESGECAVIDPGCSDRAEQDMLAGYIREHKLTPVLLLNTHCHVDHVLGNKFVFDLFGLKPCFHRLEEKLLHAAVYYAEAVGVRYELSPQAERFLEQGETVSFGQSALKCLFTPGHSPGSLSFYSENEGFVIAGDALFNGSIGRTDLPGGDFDTLIASIKNELLTLDDGVKVYPGHGPATAIGVERMNNPFLT